LSVAGVGMKQEYKAFVEQYLHEKTKLLGNKTSPTLSTTNPTCISLGLNSGLNGADVLLRKTD